MEAFLDTEHLVMRRFTESDVDDLVELHNDPEVMRFLTGGTPIPRSEIEGTTLPAILADYERHDDLGMWAAVERSSGDFVGWFALTVPEGNEPDDVELGYRLHRSAWGKGYATEGSRALIRRAFAGGAVRRIFATTMAINLGSRRVMEKSGLAFLRVFHVHFDDPLPGTEHGEVEYELLRTEWERREARRPAAR